jgi:uncharacterized protein (TIRG00374 family)
MAFGELAVASARYHVFVRRVRPGSGFALSLRAMVANRFAASVTPSQTGGGPALLYILHRSGIAVPRGLSILVVNFLLTIVGLFLVSTAALFHLRGTISSAGTQALLQYAGITAGLMFVLTLVGLFRPSAITRLFGKWLGRLDRSGSRAVRLRRFLQAAISGLDQFRSTARLLLRESPSALVQATVLTVLLFAAKYFLAWFVVLGLGISADLPTVLAVQALLHFVLYLAPSPGGSGIAELSTGALMALVIPAGFLGAFTLVYRALLIYLPAVAGAAVLYSTFRPSPASRISSQPESFALLVSSPLARTLAKSGAAGSAHGSAARSE